MSNLNIHQIEKSLFVKASIALFDALESYHFDEQELVRKSFHKETAKEFLNAMITIDQNNRLKGGLGMPVPFICFEIKEV